MRNRKAQGFTLIELLIVIAIIGILAAVLIPNLMRARNVAVDRAAQGFIQNVYTAANAYMSEDLTISAAQVVTADADCTDGATYGQYSTPAPSFDATTCTVAANAAGNNVVVTLTYNGGVTAGTTISVP